MGEAKVKAPAGETARHVQISRMLSWPKQAKMSQGPALHQKEPPGVRVRCKWAQKWPQRKDQLPPGLRRWGRGWGGGCAALRGCTEAHPCLDLCLKRPLGNQVASAQSSKPLPESVHFQLRDSTARAGWPSQACDLLSHNKAPSQKAPSLCLMLRCLCLETMLLEQGAPQVTQQSLLEEDEVQGPLL